MSAARLALARRARSPWVRAGLPGASPTGVRRTRAVLGCSAMVALLLLTAVLVARARHRAAIAELYTTPSPVYIPERDIRRCAAGPPGSYARMVHGWCRQHLAMRSASAAVHGGPSLQPSSTSWVLLEAD